jgi:hypothetical protein
VEEDSRKGLQVTKYSRRSFPGKNILNNFVTIPPVCRSSIAERGALIALKNKKQTKQ